MIAIAATPIPLYFSPLTPIGNNMSGASTAREIIDAAALGSLGTVDEAGHPYVSLVTTTSTLPAADSPAPNMLMLLSGLALHTKNLIRDSRCSLLLVQPSREQDDPLESARLTVTGDALKLSSEQARDDRERFLTRHPTSAMYVDFPDFAFFRIRIQRAHLVAGFGRIETLTADELAT